MNSILCSRFRCAMLVCVISSIAGAGAAAEEFRGTVVDAATGQTIPARIYLQSETGEWLFVDSADPQGSALAYREQWVPMPNSVEQHTTISAHPFRIDLPPGTYTIEIERGKEYLPLRETIEIGSKPVERIFHLMRFVDMNIRGWYSGETHVHRRLEELPNVMLAENLNVAFPVTFWTVRSDTPPGLEPSPLRRQGPSPFGPRADRGSDPIFVDREHVIMPRNTEYEIFSVGDKRHVLGAIFLLNHKSVFTETAPPIAPIAEKAHREGALLDLDKHSWPWSMMLVPIANVDLFELSNNSVWRTKFGFKNAPADLPVWMNLERESPTALTEWGWLNYGFEVYYALLNCGFHVNPTAGTASGVHPVPLGHSRVYVFNGATFSPDDWMQGLKNGRSFVTTGPMLFATINDKMPGAEFQFGSEAPQKLRVLIECMGPSPMTQIDLIVNGEVARSINPPRIQAADGSWQATAAEEITVDRTSWIAIRAVSEQSDGRKRFAHTAPWHITVDDQPITPVREQVEYFILLMEREIERNREVISADALAEFEAALQHYQTLLKRAEPSGL